jgi:hypothetical protein
MSATSSAFLAIRRSRSGGRLRSGDASAVARLAPFSSTAAYGLVPLVTHTPPPHLRLEDVVTGAAPLPGGVTDGLVALTVGPDIDGAELGLVTLLVMAGFAPGEFDGIAPPSTGPGFATPPTVLCFAFVAPPIALWVKPGFAAVMSRPPSRKPVTIVPILIGVNLFNAPISRRSRDGLPSHAARITYPGGENVNAEHERDPWNGIVDTSGKSPPH